MKKLNTYLLLAAVVMPVGIVSAQTDDVIIETAEALPPATVEFEAAVETLPSRVAGRSTGAAKKALVLAQAAAEPMRQDRVMTVVADGGGGSGKTVVIPKESGDAKAITEIEEDLNVMAHILDKSVAANNKTARAMGIALLGRSPFGGNLQNLYIEGHGAIFFLNVNYPLVAPPEKESTSNPKEKTSSEWEEARREIARPGKGAAEDVFVAINEQGVGGAWGGKVEYDAERVEELKKDILMALKNASHIRKLKNDETVTVVVTGGKGAVGKTIKATGGGGTTDPFTFAKTLGWEGPGNTAKLIVRAKKADAEAFKNGKLDFDEFRKHATVLIY